MSYLFKDKSYFVNYINDEQKRIEKFEDIRSKCTNKDQIDRCNLFLLNYYKNLIYCMCSIGTREEVFLKTVNFYLELFDSVKDIVPKSEQIDSIAIRYLFIDNSDTIFNDFHNKLVEIASYEPYKYFLDLLSKKNIQASFQSFMNDKWYELCIDYPWYNSHLRNNNTYVGYISFVGSAIARKYDLDISNIKYVVK